jgi:nitrogen fixation protein NifB
MERSLIEEKVTASHANSEELAHPCFDPEAKKKYARVHLPIAPNCNVQCNFCNRKFDCVNESRPGVASTILLPHQALDYVNKLMAKDLNISVIGIAGPGDPMANTAEVFETVKIIREKYPKLLYCLSTNGLDLPQNINSVTDLGLSHVTITINSMDPNVLAAIYSWVRFEKKIYRGLAAGQLLHDRQMESLRLLKERNITVKINTIVLPGINEDGIEEVAKTVSAMGADLMNCIPLYPTKDTAFEDLIEPSKQQMHSIKKKISAYIKPMAHCARCRADAAGLLGEDFEGRFKLMEESASIPLYSTEKRPYIAVATHEGYLVNRHLGETDSFNIYTQTETGYAQIDTRQAPPKGIGDFRWIQLAKTLSDCNTVLVSGAGANPLSMLKSMGLQVVQMNGLIEAGLDAVYKGKSLNGFKVVQFKCGDSCGGTGTGCG